MTIRSFKGFLPTEQPSIWEAGYTAFGPGNWGTMPGRVAGTYGWACRNNGTTGTTQQRGLAVTAPAALYQVWGFATWRSSASGRRQFAVTPIGSNTMTLNTSGQIGWGPGSSTTAYTILALSPDTWNYVEVGIKWNNPGVSSTGYQVIRINGVESLAMSGLNQNIPAAGSILDLHTNTTTAGGAGTSTPEIALADVYVTTSSSGFDWLGDSVIDTLPLEGDGETIGFLGSDGDSVNNYLNVRDPAMLLSRYNASGTVGARDLYTLGALPSGSATIHAVKSYGVGSAAAAGTAAIAPILKVSGVPDISTGSVVGLGVGETRFEPMLATSRPSGGSWTVADVNSLQAGVEVKSA